MQRKKPSPPRLDDVDRNHLWEIGGVVKKVALSLRFIGDDLSPDEITSLLECKPTKAFKKGDIIEDEKYHREATTGLWLRRSNLPESANLEKHIISLFSAISDDLTKWQYLSEKHRSDLFIGLFIEDWNKGIEFPSGLLIKVCERHLTLGFDIYCDEKEG